MTIDPELLAKLKTLDQKQLADAVRMLAEAAGADEKQTKRALDNLSYIKRRLASASEKDLTRAAEKLTAGSELDQTKIDDLEKKLRGL
jgi:hypothetical protein